MRIEAVAALGRLEPAGDLRLVAAPITGIGGTPRITELLFNEGNRVRTGQLLAKFDNGPGHRAEQKLVRTRITNLSRRLELQQLDQVRYRKLASVGAFAASDLNITDQRTLELQGQLQEAKAELTMVGIDKVNTELRALIYGTFFMIVMYVGERPCNKANLVGQKALLRSDNWGFCGTLSGIVSRVKLQVRQRRVLSTNPGGDADARTMEVRVRLDCFEARRVRDLSGLKVIARLGR